MATDAQNKIFRFALLMPLLFMALTSWLLYSCCHPPPSGLGTWYEDYARAIASLLSNEGSHTKPTFPMWGYGWVLKITESRGIAVCLQVVATILSSLSLAVSLHRAGYLSKAAVSVFLWALALYLPWYAVPVTEMSASAFGAAFLWVSISLLIRNFNDRFRLDVLLGSAIAYGLCLNFRSDYLMFTPVIITVAFSGAGRMGVIRGSTWIAVVGLMMVPWITYTKAVAGRAILTSTNAGHVLYLSWGDLPSNKWGIKIDDNDPIMNKELESHFGRKVSSLSADGDAFLKKRFMEMVAEEPLAYIKRYLYNIRNLILGGFYAGVWDKDLRQRIREKFPNENIGTLLVSKTKDCLQLLDHRSGLTILAELQARLGLVLVIIACGSMSLILLGSPSRAWLLLLSAIIYQLLTSSVVHYIRPPLNNQIPAAVAIITWIYFRNIKGAVCECTPVLIATVREPGQPAGQTESTVRARSPMDRCW